MDWIDKEIDRIKGENAAKVAGADRQAIINRKCPEAWSEFRGLIEAAVAKLNASQEMRNNIGKTDFNGGNVQILRIENESFPSVFMTITSTYNGIKVERKRRHAPDTSFESYTENLECDLDASGQVIFTNDEAGSLSIQQAAHYVLIPLVRKHDDLAFSMPASVRQ